MSEAIILLDFVLVNMESVRERRNTIVTVRGSPPRYAWQVEAKISKASKERWAKFRAARAKGKR